MFYRCVFNKVEFFLSLSEDYQQSRTNFSTLKIRERSTSRRSTTKQLTTNRNQTTGKMYRWRWTRSQKDRVKWSFLKCMTWKAGPRCGTCRVYKGLESDSNQGIKVVCVYAQEQRHGTPPPTNTHTHFESIQHTTFQRVSVPRCFRTTLVRATVFPCHVFLGISMIRDASPQRDITGTGNKESCWSGQ